MIRSALLSAIVIFQAFTSFSSEVSKESARQVAVNFFCERLNTVNPADRSSIVITEELTREAANKPLWYIFNFKPRGYVIVAADDAVVPVLAYSLDGIYSTEEPVQFTSWMKQYEDQIIYAKENNIPPLPTAKKMWSDYISPRPPALVPRFRSVSPLITSNWNQNHPYNAQCPADPAGPGGHAYAGCVPVCMAQVMYYFRWPETGTGSYSYTDPTYGVLSANFDTTYDWNNMTDAITNANSSIPLLLYHLGVSCDLVYGPGGSGMYNHKAAYSLRTYFKYSPQTQYVFRDSTSMDWDSLLIVHLDRDIPMYYAGWSLPNVNGHAFVCDGYQDSSYFHFNFGWSGQNNGYFYTSELTPGGNNFNLAQEVIINCVPDMVNHTYPPYCSGNTELNQRQGSFTDGSGPLHPYEPSSECSWTIDPREPNDSVSGITLSFGRFDLDSSARVDVYRGTTPSDPLLGTFTGSLIPPDVVSDYDRMHVVFTSAEGSSAPGFYASFSSSSPVWCTGTQTITADTAEFTDGSFGFDYHNNQACKWKVIPESGGVLTLNFRYFDTEEGTDNLRIYDLVSQALVAEISGHYDSINPPAPVTVESGQAFLIFNTNSSATGQGWEIYYPRQNLGLGENGVVTDVQLYPNPAKDKVAVKFTASKSTPATITVTDAGGRTLFVQPYNVIYGNNAAEIDVRGLQPGIYLLILETEGRRVVKKLVIC